MGIACRRLWATMPNITEGNCKSLFFFFFQFWKILCSRRINLRFQKIPEPEIYRNEVGESYSQWNYKVTEDESIIKVLLQHWSKTLADFWRAPSCIYIMSLMAFCFWNLEIMRFYNLDWFIPITCDRARFKTYNYWGTVIPSNVGLGVSASS